jgi:hypothetical protein
MTAGELLNVYGADLRGGLGFESIKAAKATWDMDKPPYERVHKIDGVLYQVVKILEKPVLVLYQE